MGKAAGVGGALRGAVWGHSRARSCSHPGELLRELGRDGRGRKEKRTAFKFRHEKGGAGRFEGSEGLSVQLKARVLGDWEELKLEGWPDRSRSRGAQGSRGTQALDRNVVQEAAS